ncbi:CLUMA_CG017683, isoform A [Clunio marinus]|uniref:CLUMA_CG017683, isoform A n=1 Tax=Clunio marinus TaxID=568069 RepID=A0A1J1IWT1_9DIPT|nr:CLUMA_CG017683, isoform A [Clunio marinus]
MIKFTSILLFLATVNCCFAFWSPCPGGLPAPSRVVSPFCDAIICNAQRGTILTAEADFTTTAAHTFLDTRLSTTILGLPVTLPMDPGMEDACQFLVPGCPTLVNGMHTLMLNAPVPTGFPAISNVNIRIELVDPTMNRIAMCAIVRANII